MKPPKLLIGYVVQIQERERTDPRAGAYKSKSGSVQTQERERLFRLCGTGALYCLEGQRVVLRSFKEPKHHLVVRGT